MALRERIKRTLLILCGYILFYLILRVLWVARTDKSFLGWLTTTSPYEVKDYLYGWMMTSNMLWIVVLISMIFSLLGKHWISLSVYIGSVLGYILGYLFGPNPEGASIGQGHYGWVIWIVSVLVSAVLGIIIEKRLRKY